MDDLKILIYFSSHRQLKEIEYSSYFINRTSFLKNKSEVMIHCDNDSLSNSDIEQYTKFEINHYISRTKQTFPIYPHGYYNGFLKGLSNNFDFFQNYDIVIHLVPDCYITFEDRIKNLIIENLNTDYNFIVDESHANTFCCDFFIFKPKKIVNIFSEHNDEIPLQSEIWLYKKINEHKIPHKIICRGEKSLSWKIDDYGLIHNHELETIESILKYNKKF